MDRAKNFIAAFLFVASGVALMSVASALSAVMEVYRLPDAESLSPNAFGFSRIGLVLASNATVICIGTLLATLAGVLAARKMAQDKLFLVVVLALINYHVSAFLLGAVLLGLFVLPQLANTV